MANDCIKREDVAEEIKIICQNCRDTCAQFDGLDPDCESGCGIFDLKSKIAAIPAADVRPVVRGGFVGKEKVTMCYTRECSNCHGQTPTSGTFCSVCGADLREAGNG